LIRVWHAKFTPIMIAINKSIKYNTKIMSLVIYQQKKKGAYELPAIGHNTKEKSKNPYFMEEAVLFITASQFYSVISQNYV